MPNCREINAVLAEFQLNGAWFKKVRQPDYRGIILEFSSLDDPSALAVIMAPPYPRLHLIASKDKRTRVLPKPPGFTAVLKSRLQGVRLNPAAQLGLDRIVRFAHHPQRIRVISHTGVPRRRQPEPAGWGTITGSLNPPAEKAAPGTPGRLPESEGGDTEDRGTADKSGISAFRRST